MLQRRWPRPHPAFQLRSTMGDGPAQVGVPEDPEWGPCLCPDPALSTRPVRLWGAGASPATPLGALRVWGPSPVAKWPCPQLPPPGWCECACVRAELLFHIANINKGRQFTILLVRPYVLGCGVGSLCYPCTSEAGGASDPVCPNTVSCQGEACGCRGPRLGQALALRTPTRPTPPVGRPMGRE